MKLMSSDQEQEIEKTLSALGAVEPSPGFESRVLRGLEQRAMECGKRREAREFGNRFRIATAFGSAVALLILALAVSAHLRTHRRDDSQVRSVPALSPGVSPAASEREGALHEAEPALAVSSFRASAEAARARGLLHSAPALVLTGPETPVRLEVEADAATVRTARELDAQAAEDFRAPSSLAPTLPLTAQERLVRLMLRRGEKHDLAQLDPTEQAAFASQEQAAFHDFFDPPPDPRVLHQTEAEQGLQSTPTTHPKTEGQPQ